MKAILLAAGEGSRMKELTLNNPKPLVDINGKSILERQISLLKKFNVTEIFIITGPFPNKYNFQNVSYINDINFKDHDQLGSLGVGINEIHEDVLIIFADIIFDESILEKVCNNNSNVVIAVDMDWKKYESRTDNTIEDADKVSISNGEIQRIFKQKNLNDQKFDIGEFIGLMKLNSKGSKSFSNIFLNLQKYTNKKFHDAESFKKAKLVDFLQEMLEQKIKIKSEIINGKWCEIDTSQD